MGIEKYSVSLEKEVVDEARNYLEVGQKLSPMINQLLKKWIEEKKQKVKIMGDYVTIPSDMALVHAGKTPSGIDYYGMKKIKKKKSKTHNK